MSLIHVVGIEFDKFTPRPEIILKIRISYDKECNLIAKTVKLF
jgi:hypothetical protein